jgi:carboxylesterase
MTKIRSQEQDAVLLIHGLSGNPLEMQYLARRLRSAGFATSVPQLAGYGYCGRSDPFAVGTWRDWRSQVAEHFETLASAHRSVCVAGLCIGAVLALDLAARRPGRVAALSLLSTTLAYDGWSLPWYRFLAPLGLYTPLRYCYSYRERHPFGVKNALLRKWIEREMSETTTSIAGAARLPMTAVYQAKRLIGHVRRAMPAVTAPALVVHAVEDDVASVRSAQFVADNIGSSQVELVLLRDSYHMVTLDNEKDRVAEDTVRFFRSHTAKVATLPQTGTGALQQRAIAA